MAKPQFLSNEDVTSFRRGRCVFCDLEMETRNVGEREAEEKRGSEYTEHYVPVLRKTYVVESPDIYFFEFSFDHETKECLRSKQKETVEGVKKDLTARAGQLRKDLTIKFSQLDFNQRERDVSVEALVDDFLRELKPKSTYGDYYPLVDRIGNLFHNLQLGDLSIICNSFGDADITDQGQGKFDLVKTYFFPRGLKTHKGCWPYDPIDGPESSFSVPFGDFFGHIQRNMRFANYESSFEDFPDLWQYMLELDVMVNAKTYNPLDFVQA